MAVFRRAFNTYQRILNTHPVLTHSVQTGLLMGTGDVIAQTVVEKKELKSIDKIRVIKFASIGFCFVGPFLQVWYTQLARFATGSPYVVTAKKVFADQVIAAPIMAFSVLSLVSLVDGHNIEETKMKLKKTYWDVLLANYKLWPLVQVVNFAFVPLNYQVLVVQVVAIFWNTYLSYKTH